jgi:hypothetical protein
MNIYIYYFVLSSILFCGINTVSALPVFPGAQGFGTETRAAYGGGSDPTVYKVTNLNASGFGSLRECAEASGPRICIFEVSGTIKVTSDIVANDPYLTIAGQTAPSPGITIRGAAIHFRTHDILIQHIRIRVGDDPAGPDGENRDGLKISNKGGEVYNVVADHVSVSWGTDETVQLYYDQHDGASNISIIKNLMAHGNNRNPRVRSSVEIINNVMYNYGYEGTTIAEDIIDVTVRGNVYITGPDTNSSPSTEPINFRNIHAQAQIYLNDNSENGVIPGDQWDLTKISAGGAPTHASSPPIKSSGLTVLANASVKAAVLTNAGARPADRDSVDNRIVNDVTNGTGRIINSQNEVGGWPNLAKNHRTLNLPGNMHDDDDGDGYTNLEEWLHAFAAEVEGSGSSPAPDPSAKVPYPPANLRIID